LYPKPECPKQGEMLETIEARQREDERALAADRDAQVRRGIPIYV